MVTVLLSTETSNELVSCVRGPEDIGRTRRVRSAIDCN
jgi:hypothetical protein